MANRPRVKVKSAWQASMSVALGLGLGFFVLTSVAGILGVGLVVGYQNTVDLLTQKSELIINSQREQTEQFFRSAQNQVEFISDQIRKNEIEPGRSVEFVSLLLGAVSATPQIIRIQFIDTDYELTGVERQDDESLPIFRRVGDDLDLKQLLDKAGDGIKPYWGAILWRQEYEQAVLNYQQSVSRSGKLLGVISAWISINQMSEFLSDLEAELGANAFILHGRDQVLAHPLMAFGYPGLNRRSPLPSQNKFSDPVVSAMWDERERFTIAERFLAGPQVRFVAYGELEYVILYRELTGYADQPLLIATYFESHDMTAEAARMKWAIIFCFLMAVFSAAAAAYIGHQIAQPVRRLAEGAKRIHELDLASVNRIPRSFFRELDDAGQSFNVMLDGLRWFERYVPKTLVKRLMHQNPDGEIESSYQKVVIMFTDIVGFTTLSENLTAPATADFLNKHFDMIAKFVEAEAGTVDKFIGDSVMALWGAPERQADPADRACRCALNILRAVADMNRSRQPAVTGAPKVRLRIGIHLGRVVVGNIGGSDRVSYTVVGDAVNVARRLEEAAKTLSDTDSDVTVFISGSVKGSLVMPFNLIHLGSQKLRGREEHVEVYVLTDQNP
jgi:class 3 adenylate cyclase